MLALIMSRPRHAPAHRTVLACLIFSALLATTTARAASLELVPTRARGMGGALRGAAAGTSAPALNPSGISLVRSYVVEGAYHYLQDQSGHLAQVALSDSTSASNIGGAVMYTYGTASKDGAESSRHEGTLSLSFPFGDYVALGGSVRYLKLRATPAGGAEDKRSGFTFDAGLTIRPSAKLSIGLVGYGLKDFKDPQVPRAFGGGVALLPLAELVIVADLVLDQRTYEHALDPTVGNAWSFMGGAEYTFVSRLGVRLGGGHDGVRDRGYLTAGLTALGEMGAIDVGARLDLGGTHPANAMYVGVALRLFVPSP
jgi:hypothetical protein